MTTVEAHAALVPALNFLGLAIKRSPAKDWTIPFALAACGAVGFPAITAWTGANVLQGILAASAAVAANQMWRQGSEALKTNDK